MNFNTVRAAVTADVLALAESLFRDDCNTDPSNIIYVDSTRRIEITFRTLGSDHYQTVPRNGTRMTRVRADSLAHIEWRLDLSDAGIPSDTITFERSTDGTIGVLTLVSGVSSSLFQRTFDRMAAYSVAALS